MAALLRSVPLDERVAGGHNRPGATGDRVYSCRMCRREIFTEGDIETHEVAQQSFHRRKVCIYEIWEEASSVKRIATGLSHSDDQLAAYQNPRYSGNWEGAISLFPMNQSDESPSSRERYTRYSFPTLHFFLWCSGTTVQCWHAHKKHIFFSCVLVAFDIIEY